VRLDSRTQNFLIRLVFDSIIIEDANQNMKDEYLVAKVAEAKEAINRLAGTFDEGYGLG
jgi:hypothetical protein